MGPHFLTTSAARSHIWATTPNPSRARPSGRASGRRPRPLIAGSRLGRRWTDRTGRRRRPDSLDVKHDYALPPLRWVYDARGRDLDELSIFKQRSGYSARMAVNAALTANQSACLLECSTPSSSGSSSRFSNLTAAVARCH